MPTILQKISNFFNADIRGMIDRALETHSLRVIDEYSKQLHAYEEALGRSMETVAGSIRTLKRKYEEFAAQADEDKDIDALILRGKDDLAAAGPGYLNTKAELAQEYYEQWQAQEEQLQDLQALSELLKQRIDTVKHIRETIYRITEHTQELSDDEVNAIYEQADAENARFQAWLDKRQNKSNDIEDTFGIRRLALQLEERKRRLLGKD